MKAVEAKHTSPALPSPGVKSFFQKEGGESTFFSDRQTDIQTKPFFGSRATQPFIQPKLAVGRPDDKYEQEADVTADRVVQRLSNPETVQTNPATSLANTVTPLVQPKCATCEQEEQIQKKEEEEGERLEETVQRKPVFESGGPPPEEEEIQRKCAECEASSLESGIKLGNPEDQFEKEADIVAKSITKKDFTPSVQHKTSGTPVSSHSNIREGSLTSGGTTLPPTVQQFFESKMGYDFSDVRVHTGEEASQKSNALNAHAFTYGNHIWLDREQKVEPSFIMAHEMAHVVQQTQPKVRKFAKKKYLLAHSDGVLCTNRIQRFIFWNEYKAGIKNRPGQETHNEVEKDLENNSGIKTEIAIPTGNTKGVGFGFDGRADLYGDTNPVGVTFQKGGDIICPNGEALGKPKKLNTSKKNKRPNFTDTGNIVKINSAPTVIKVGDLKPANEAVVKDGRDQVNNYKEGLKFTKDRVNCWSDLHPDSKGNSPQWSLSPQSFDASSLPIPGDYAPGSGPTRQLGISNFNMVSDEAGLKPKTEKIVSPHDLGIDIDGEMIALHAGGGVIAYAYVPLDYNAIITALSLQPNSKELIAYAEFASDLQNKVILPLLTAPKKPKGKTKKRKNGEHKKYAIKTDSRNKPSIQRKPKAKLEDKFKLGNWKKNHQQHQNNFKTKKRGTRDKLQFLELIYKADSNLKKAGVKVPGKKLPDKDQFDIPLAKSPKGKKQEKNLTTLYSWMNLWAKKPMKFLGTLRAKFGSMFVKVANKFASLKEKLDKKLKNAEKSNSPKGKSYGQIAVRAFWKALVRIGGVVFEDTIKLLVESLESGLKNKMEEVIPLDTEELEKRLEDGFPELKQIQETIEQLEADINAKIEEVTGKYDEDIKALKSAAEDAETLGEIIKWAMVAIQCASPPGWGCLKLLAKRLIAEVIDEILSWCATKKKFNEAVLATGMFDEMPKRIASNMADIIEGSIPGLSPVFDRKVFELSKKPDPDKIPCDKEIPTEVQKEMVLLEITLKKRLGDEGYLLFLEAVEKYGVAPDTEITVEKIREIKEKVPHGVTPEELRMFIASNPRPKPGKRIILDVADFLERVKEAGKKEDLSWYHIVHPPSRGHTKFRGNRYDVEVSISPYQPSTQWTIIKKFTMPATVTNRVWTDASKKLFRIEYRALQDVEFDLYKTEKGKISEGDFIKGYRPDIFKE